MIQRQVLRQGLPWLNYGFSGREPNCTSQPQLEQRLLAKLAWREPPAIIKQVNGTEISPLSACKKPPQCADGWLLDKKNTLALLRVADCVPALLYDAKAGLAVMLHAGRSGIAEGILTQALSQLFALKARPERLSLVLGPAIGGCCYQLPRAMADDFITQTACPACRCRVDGQHSWIDLKETLKMQALRSGLSPENLHCSSSCTLCRQRFFYSHRGGDTTLRQYLFAWLSEEHLDR